MKRIITFAGCVAAFLFLAGHARAALNVRETPIVKVVKQNAPAVVNISTERIVLLRENPYWGHYGNELDMFFGQFFGFYRPRRALKLKSVGSGVIVDTQGLVVTNAHVVNRASNIFVVLNDGTSIEGRVVYESPREDLAIVRIETAQPLSAVRLGQTEDLMIGETVVAIGNPLGLENSVTAGVVSGKDRTLAFRSGQASFEGLIQTDAPINPGNSGGALLNLNGELIGINVAVVQHSQNIGFAIPVERVQEAILGHARNKSLAVHQRSTKAVSPQAPSRGSSAPTGQAPDPFEEFSGLRKDMDRMFQEFFSSRPGVPRGGMLNTDFFYHPDYAIEETDSAYIVTFDISGLDREKLDVEIGPHSITISGERSMRSEETSPSRKVTSKSYGSFMRMIPVPEGAKTEKVRSEIREDKLVITLPKK